MIDGFKRPTGRDVPGQCRDVIGQGADAIQVLANLLQSGVFTEAPGVRRGGPIDHAALGNPVMHHQDAGDVTIMQQRVTGQMHRIQVHVMAVFLQVLGRMRRHGRLEQALRMRRQALPDRRIEIRIGRRPQSTPQQRCNPRLPCVGRVKFAVDQPLVLPADIQRGHHVDQVA